LDEETLNKIWKEIKMIDIFAFAHEKGEKKGIKNSIFTILESSIGKIPENIADKVNSIAHESTLLDLLKIAPGVKDLVNLNVLLLRDARKISSSFNNCSFCF
jgi:hypothetical protein